MALVGIDLGTCNSVITTMRDQRVEVIPNQAGKQTTPSVVFFDTSRLEDASVGESAVFSAGSNPARVVRFIKKVMGEDHKVVIDDQTYTPEQISSRILQAMIRDAQENYFDGEPITEAVITVPAWFGMQQRDATKRAAELAGLTVRLILAEPIAAAIDFAESHGEDLVGKTVLVYDLGGGTFDATLITVSKNAKTSSLEFRVLNKEGSINLGGYNWDIELRNYVAAQFAQANENKNPTDDPVSADILMIECQRAKELLSLKDRDVKIPIPCTHAGISSKVEVTRGQFESMTQHLLDESIGKVSQLIEDTFREDNPDASKEALWEHVDMILLAGGSTKMPIVVETLERLSGKKPRTHKGVDLNVGRGAAYVMFSPHLWADKSGLDASLPADTPAGPDGTVPKTERDRIRQQGPKMVIQDGVDTATESVGIIVVDSESDKDFNCVIIKQGTAFGQEIEQSFGIYQDGQTGVDIIINAGNAKEISDVLELGHVKVLGLPPTTRQGEEIRVKLKLDQSGLITGSAMHVKSGTVAEIRVQLKARSTDTRVSML